MIFDAYCWMIATMGQAEYFAVRIIGRLRIQPSED